MDFSYAGMAAEVIDAPNVKNMSIRNTHQFSLEVIMHYKLLNSAYRTKNPNEAHVFYIPSYVGLKCMSNHAWSEQYLDEYLNELETFLLNQTHFKEGKPHISSIAKIHREMAGYGCRYLYHPISKNITYFAIEKENSPNVYSMQDAAQSVIVVPYPSYMHYTGNNVSQQSFKYTRNILALYPVGVSKFPEIRAVLGNQFTHKTEQTYEDFMRSEHDNNSSVDMVQILTEECERDGEQVTKVVSWMTHSLFCLQPPGDSPTRKSFYDSILCGCIPVIFKENQIPYAFSSILDYHGFSVVIDISSFIQNHEHIENILRKISASRIKNMQRRLDEISKFMQYSETNNNDYDATELIMRELAQVMKL